MNKEETKLSRLLKAVLRIGAFGAAITLVSALLYPLLIEPWHERWGATDKELTMTVPGDDVVEKPVLKYTHAITINAPVEKVWPWIVQIGQGRGGLYSYDWLENIIGCDIHSADRIHPEWQNIEPGDDVRFGPKDSSYPKIPVYAVEPGKALILGAAKDKDGSAKTWTFFLKKAGDNSTRLIIRSRHSYARSTGNFIMWRVITNPLNFIMERKMMFGIKERAESN